MDVRRQALYRRAKPIAMQALDLPVDKREAWLKETCDDDRPLRKEVDWIVRAAETTDGGGPADDDVLCYGDDLQAAGSSTYHVLRPLGEGGMGMVYLAERAAGDARQQLALKLLPTMGVTDGVHARRFAEECRILARLAHPNIAYLVDSGRTRNGRPFLAMEYVEGERIDSWCRHHALSIPACVKLFLKVCAAVEYAHRQLVIHRDIKPSNILVTDAGEPKLLDFGIARLLGEDTKANLRTVTALRALTIAYASPEQILGEPLSTAVDVWSLGVVLYQLLCGVRPFSGEDDTASPLQVSNAIVAGRVRPPSYHGDRYGKVPVDLDAVVLKALRREPGRRYASVAELAADLQCWLDLRPVQAHHGARWYRVRLFFRRHYAGLATAALVLVLLVAFGVARQMQVHRLEVQRDKTRAIATFMSNLFEDADPTHAHGNHVTVREVLDRGAAELEKRSDIGSAARAAMLLSIGRAYNALTMGSKAIPVLKKAMMLQQHSGASVLERAHAMAALGRAYSMVINLSSSVKADKQAIALLKRAPGSHRDEILRVRINLLYGQFGAQQMTLQHVAEQLKSVLVDLDKQADADPALTIQALAALAMARAYLGDGAGASNAAQQALEQAKRLYKPDNPALVYYRFVAALALVGTDPDAAVARYRQTLADFHRTLGSPSPSLAAVFKNFGQALIHAGRPREALSALQHGAKIARHFATIAPDFQLGVELALAHGYAVLGRDKDALAVLQHWQTALAERASLGGNWALGQDARALNLQGQLVLRRGKPEQAAHYFDQALKLLKSRHRAARHASAYAASLTGLGAAALARGDKAGVTRFARMLATFRRQVHAAPGSMVDLDVRLLHARQLVADGDIRHARMQAVDGARDSLHHGGPCDDHYRAFRALLASLPAAPTRVSFPECASAVITKH